VHVTQSRSEGKPKTATCISIVEQAGDSLQLFVRQQTGQDQTPLQANVQQQPNISDLPQHPMVAQSFSLQRAQLTSIQDAENVSSIEGKKGSSSVQPTGAQSMQLPATQQHPHDTQSSMAPQQVKAHTRQVVAPQNGATVVLAPPQQTGAQAVSKVAVVQTENGSVANASQQTDVQAVQVIGAVQTDDVSVVSSLQQTDPQAKQVIIGVQTEDALVLTEPQVDAKAVQVPAAVKNNSAPAMDASQQTDAPAVRELAAVQTGSASVVNAPQQTDPQALQVVAMVQTDNAPLINSTQQTDPQAVQVVAAVKTKDAPDLDASQQPHVPPTHVTLEQQTDAMDALGTSQETVCISLQVTAAEQTPCVLPEGISQTAVGQHSNGGPTEGTNVEEAAHMLLSRDIMHSTVSMRTDAPSTHHNVLQQTDNLSSPEGNMLQPSASRPPDGSPTLAAVAQQTDNLAMPKMDGITHAQPPRLAEQGTAAQQTDATTMGEDVRQSTASQLAIEKSPRRGLQTLHSTIAEQARDSSSTAPQHGDGVSIASQVSGFVCGEHFTLCNSQAAHSKVDGLSEPIEAVRRLHACKNFEAPHRTIWGGHRHGPLHLSSTRQRLTDAPDKQAVLLHPAVARHMECPQGEVHAASTRHIDELPTPELTKATGKQWPNHLRKDLQLKVAETQTDQLLEDIRARGAQQAWVSAVDAQATVAQRTDDVSCQHREVKRLLGGQQTHCVNKTAGAEQSAFAQQSGAPSGAAVMSQTARSLEKKRMQLMPARIEAAQQPDNSFLSGTETVLAGVGQYSNVPQEGDIPMTSQRLGGGLEWQMDRSSKAQDGAGTRQLTADQHMVALLREASAHTALAQGLLQEISQASPLHAGMPSSPSPSRIEPCVCGDHSGSFAQIPLFPALFQTRNAQAMQEKARAWRASNQADDCATSLNPRYSNLEGCTEEFKRELSGSRFDGLSEVDGRPRASPSSSRCQPKMDLSLTDACVSPVACHRSNSQLSDGLIAVPQDMDDVSLRGDHSTVSLTALNEQTDHQRLGKSECLSVTSLSMDYVQMMGRMTTAAAQQQNSTSLLQTESSHKPDALSRSSLKAVAQDTDDVSLRGEDHSIVSLAAPDQQIDHQSLAKSGCLSGTSLSMDYAQMMGRMLTQPATQQSSLSPLQTKSSQKSDVLLGRSLIAYKSAERSTLHSELSIQPSTGAQRHTTILQRAHGVCKWQLLITQMFPHTP
jgi:hypothetical protein